MSLMNPTINLKELYEFSKQSTPQELSVEQAIVELNYFIAGIIVDALKENLYTSSITQLYSSYFTLLTYTAQQTNANADEEYAKLETTSNKILAELNNKEDKITSMCYMIGTSSELNVNYTVTEKMMVVTAIIREFDINLIFS